MIEIKQLSYQYPQANFNVLDNVKLEIPAGSLTLVTGASGSGKSTLLRCINGLVPHFTGGKISGEIRVFGADPVRQGVAKMADTVGFVFQEPEAQFVFDAVEDEIVFYLENMGIPREKMDRRINQVLQEIKISALRHKKIKALSGGEQQKVAIASALVTQPKVLILDEPTSQLDPSSAEEVLTFILELKSRLNLTVLISEHRLERLLPYVDLVINLTSDRKILFGEPQQVLPSMEQVPPIIEISQNLGITPLPLTPASFPNLPVPESSTTIKLNKDIQKDNQDHPLVINQLSTKIGENQILENINLDISVGEILVLMGPNGSGKTTLLRSILGLIPSTGELFLNKNNITNYHFSEVIQNIAYLPQNPNDLLFAESILDELRTTLKNHRLTLNDERISTFLDHFGLAEKQSHYPRDLSVGERQRTAIAAITVHNPNIILLDEPTRGLDYYAKRSLKDLFQRWRDQNKAILLVTHDVEFAAQLADRVAILEKGHLIFTGTPETAFSEISGYQTQTAQLFPGSGWITPQDVLYPAQ